MAHNLAVKEDGTAAMAYNNAAPDSRPWHGLGTPVFGLMTSEDALKKGGLDFEVSKQDMFCNVGSEVVKIPDNFAVVRSDNKAVLGVVGNQYTPIQNLEAFNFFDNIVSEQQAMFETVGAIGKGERVWIMAKLPDDVIVRGDVVNNYLLLHNTHDGSSTLTAQFTPVRVVCQNTLTLALKNCKHKVAIRHSRNADERLKTAHELLGITRKVYAHTNELFTAMDARGVSKEEVIAYFDSLFDISKKKAERIAKNKKRDNSRLSNIVEKCTELFEAGKGNHGKSLWDLYNGVIEWTDHHRSLKEGEDRWVSGTFGSGTAVKEKAFELAQAML